jgi:methionyl aminopeptidase
MPIVLKSLREIDAMRHAGQIVALVLEELRENVRPGVTTGDLDRLAAAVMAREGGRSAFLGYRGFPAHICTSVNEQVLHGIPGRRVLRDGDLLKLDVGIEWHGLCADAAISVVVGRGNRVAEQLVAVAEEAFWAGFAQARPGKHVGDIGAAIAAVIRRAGFAVIEGYAGHGVGRALHEEPSVPNDGQPGEGVLLRSGMTLAIEPMLAAGSGKTRVLRDGWTVVTLDGRLAAHFEHTVWVRDDGPMVLTQP